MADIDPDIQRAAEVARQTLRLEIRKSEGHYSGPLSEGYAQQPPLLPWQKLASYERDAWCAAIRAALKELGHG